MNILIVGTGVIGTLYGCALAEKHTISHFVRSEKLNAFDQKKISYDFIDERNAKKQRNTNGYYTYRCVDKANDKYDLIIVCVKTHQLSEALFTLVTQAPNVNYLLFTLDWNSSSEYDKLLNKKQYVIGYAGGGGTFRKDLLWANLGNDIMLGAVYNEQRPLLNIVIELFKSCKITPKVPGKPLHWLWIHNVGSAPLGVALTKYNNIDLLLKDKTLIKTSFLAMREGYKICEKRGVDLKLYDEAKMMSLPLWILCPMFKFNFTKNPVMQRYTAHAVDSIGEMVHNFKEIFKTGNSLGLNMPNMELLNTLIK